MKVELNYVGKHQPKGVYEVKEQVAEELVKTPNWEYVGKPKPKPKKAFNPDLDGDGDFDKDDVSIAGKVLSESKKKVNG